MALQKKLGPISCKNNLIYNMTQNCNYSIREISTCKQLLHREGPYHIDYLSMCNAFLNEHFKACPQEKLNGVGLQHKQEAVI
jgi:hypothetical protein